MRSYLLPFLGAMVAYVVANVVVTMSASSNGSILFLLCPAVAAIVADLWHARVSPILSAEHISVVFLPTVVMFAVQILFAVTISTPMGGIGYYMVAFLLYLLVAGLGFAASALVRTLIFGFGYDPDDEAFAY